MSGKSAALAAISAIGSQERCMSVQSAEFAAISALGTGDGLVIGSQQQLQQYHVREIYVSDVSSVCLGSQQRLQQFQQ